MLLSMRIQLSTRNQDPAEGVDLDCWTTGPLVHVQVENHFATSSPGFLNGLFWGG